MASVGLNRLFVDFRVESKGAGGFLLILIGLKKPMRVRQRIQ